MKRSKNEFSLRECACGSDRIRPGSSRRTVHYVDANGRRRSLRVAVRFDRCEKCGHAWHLPAHLADVHGAIVGAMGFVPPATVRQRRRTAGLTQRQLANRARIGVRRMSALERGLGFPTPEEDGRLRVALGLRGKARSARAI